MELILIITLRLTTACIFAIGSILLALKGQAGWGWCILAAIALGCISVETRKERKEVDHEND